MPSVRFELVRPDLTAVERFRPDLLVVELHQGERPFAGLLEQVDWRLCGLVSRAVARGRVTGEEGELVLVPGAPHLGTPLVLVVGLGARSGVSALVCNRVVLQVVRGARRLGASCVAMPLPGRAAGAVGATLGARFLRNTSPPAWMRFVIIDDESAHLELAGALG